MTDSKLLLLLLFTFISLNGIKKYKKWDTIVFQQRAQNIGRILSLVPNLIIDIILIQLIDINKSEVSLLFIWYSFVQPNFPFRLRVQYVYLTHCIDLPLEVDSNWSFITVYVNKTLKHYKIPRLISKFSRSVVGKWKLFLQALTWAVKG